MIDWLEDWLLRLGLLNAEGLMARAALCAEDNQRLTRGNRSAQSNSFARRDAAVSPRLKAMRTASSITASAHSFVDK